MTTLAARDAAASMWERTDLTPADVDVAELYDGFGILTMVWLEEIGFCAKGESGPFVEGGARIALDGALPLNTSGGQLSAGRLHGFGFLHEACLQLRGDAGERQVNANPRWPPWPPAAAPSPAACSSPAGRADSVHLHYDDETEAFRQELRAWMEANLPPAHERTERVESSAHIPEWARRWQRRLFDAGWLIPGWPPEYGGRNATSVQQMVYFEELARLGVPRTCNPQGLSIITPSIIDWGTDEQKERYAVPTLQAEISWCLGMSEPNAGSDLAGLRTRAELVDGHFVVNGQKVWTSGAHDANYCFCFVRTDPDAPKHAGISVLIIDMSTPGIDIRPLAELTDRDHADFNEVFFTDVEVPAENLVGELHHGWTIAGGSLAHERGMLWISEVTGIERTIQRVLSTVTTPLSDGRRLADDSALRDTIARAYVSSQALKVLGYQGFAKISKGKPAPEHSLLKLLGSELRRGLAQDITDALGPLGTDVDRMDAPAIGRKDAEAWVLFWLQSFSGTIAGGTSEIQRNIIAERVLGLPRR